jgi:hypothetical protein
MDLDKETMAQLRRAVTGSILTPQDPEYEPARTTFYGGIDRRLGQSSGSPARRMSRVSSSSRERDPALAIRSGGQRRRPQPVRRRDRTRPEKRCAPSTSMSSGRTAWAEVG